MIEAELHDGRVLEFPDGTDPSVVQSTVKKMLKPPEESKLQKGFLTAADFLVKSSPLGVIGAAGEIVDKAAYKAGEFSTDAATKLGASPELAAGYGIGANLAVQAPFMLAGGEAGKLASPAFRTAAKDMMQSALKPRFEQLETGKAAAAVDTLLKEGINVTQGGVEALRARINDLNQRIFQAIKDSPATVDKNKAASALMIPLKKFEMQVNPAADVGAIERAWNEFLAHPLLSGVKDIPVATAQELKQGTYRSLGSKAYGEMKGAEIEAQKHLARGLKEGIAEAVPGIGALNAEESKLLNALDLTERRVLMDANKNPGGLSWLAKNPAAWAAFMADRSPTFKSLAARLMNSQAEAAPASLGRAVGAGVGAYEGQGK